MVSHSRPDLDVSIMPAAFSEHTPAPPGLPRMSRRGFVVSPAQAAQMSSRASLRKCVETMSTLFAQGRYTTMAIIANDPGKYYTLLTPDELETKTARARPGHDRLILHCTKGELESILKSEQQNLFPNNEGRT